MCVLSDEPLKWSLVKWSLDFTHRICDGTELAVLSCQSKRDLSAYPPVTEAQIYEELLVTSSWFWINYNKQIIMFQRICSQRQSQRNRVDHFILNILGEAEFDLLMLMMPAFNDALMCVLRTRMWWDDAMTSPVSEWVRTTVTTSCWVFF